MTLSKKALKLVPPVLLLSLSILCLASDYKYLEIAGDCMLVLSSLLYWQPLAGFLITMPFAISGRFRGKNK